MLLPQLVGIKEPMVHLTMPRAALLCQVICMQHSIDPEGKMDNSTLFCGQSIQGPTYTAPSPMFKVKDGLSQAPHKETHASEGSGWHCT